MPDSPMLNPLAIHAADCAAFQAREYTRDCVQAFLAAQDREALTDVVLHVLVAEGHARVLEGGNNVHVEHEDARAVVDALLGDLEPRT